MLLRFGCKLSIVLLICSINSSEGVDSKDHVVLVAPVLAPPKTARARVTETAKDFPVLMLLATEENGGKVITPKMPDPLPIPIYVQKLEDIKPTYMRRRRFSKLHVFKSN